MLHSATIAWVRGALHSIRGRRCSKCCSALAGKRICCCWEPGRIGRIGGKRQCCRIWTSASPVPGRRYTGSMSCWKGSWRMRHPLHILAWMDGMNARKLMGGRRPCPSRPLSTIPAPQSIPRESRLACAPPCRDRPRKMHGPIC